MPIKTQRCGTCLALALYVAICTPLATASEATSTNQPRKQMNFSATCQGKPAAEFVRITSSGAQCTIGTYYMGENLSHKCFILIKYRHGYNQIAGTFIAPKSTERLGCDAKLIEASCRSGCE